MTRRKLGRTVGALALVVGLSGVAMACGNAQTESPPAPAPPASPAWPTVPAVPEHETEPPKLFDTNERGHVELDLGEEAKFHGFYGTGDATFRFNDVAVDPTCDPELYGVPAPEGQHTLLLDVTVRTGQDLEAANELYMLLTSANFAEIGTDGVTRNVGPGGCVRSENDLVLQTFGPNQTYNGTLEMTVPEANGKLIMRNSGGYDPAGWELNY